MKAVATILALPFLIAWALVSPIVSGLLIVLRWGFWLTLLMLLVAAVFAGMGL